MSLYGQYANAFMGSLQNIFSMMLSLPLRIGKPYIKENRTALYDFSSIISLTGDINGCMILSMPNQTAYILASALTGETITIANEDCVDAIGEICNMIAGNAKKEFPGDNHLSIPKIVLGRSDVAYPKDVAIITIPCETSSNRMVVDVALEKKAIWAATRPVAQSEETSEV